MLLLPPSLGTGIVLITVSGLAWRLVATDAPSCRALLGLGPNIDYDEFNNNGGSGGEPRFLSRLPSGFASGGGGAGGGGNGNGNNSSNNACTTVARGQHPYAGTVT